MGIKDEDTQGDNRLLVSFIEGANPLVASGKAILIPQGGAIRGQDYHDLDGDGVRDAAERGLSGWTSDLDANDNGLRDAGETDVSTDASGIYAFIALGAGTYVVREVLLAVWALTAPAAGSHALTRAGGQAFTGMDFGDARPTSITGAL